MQTLITLFVMLMFNGMGAYIAYRLITWFETNRTEVNPLVYFKPNIRKVK